MADDSREFVSRAARRIKFGRIPKGVTPFLGRSVVRAIPILATGLAVIEFTDNVEAHGFGGAVVRATPLLGDLVSAHDLGSELARQIRDDAEAAATQHEYELNQEIRQSWEEADAQTIAAFHELASQIRVTNQPLSAGGALVDAQEIAEALGEYRRMMQLANRQRIRGAKGSDFKAAAARNKAELRTRLERASQRDAPKTRVVPGLPVF